MAIDTTDISSLGSDRELIQKLQLAIADLLWLSESEYPFQVFYHRDADITVDKLLQHRNYPPQTNIETREFRSFFASATKEESWHNREEKAEIKRYQALINLMAENLTDIRVYLLGKIEIDAYILGTTEHKAIAGIVTKIIAT